MFGLLNAVPVEEHNLGGRSEPQCEHSYSWVTVDKCSYYSWQVGRLLQLLLQVHIRWVRTSIGTSF